MQARVIQPREPGPALGLRPASLMLPPPAPNALTVWHIAIGVNSVNVYHHAGLYSVSAFPTVLSVKGVDMVEAVGTDVRGFAAGQCVARVGLVDGMFGGHTSYRNILIERATALPDTLDDETVTATLVRGITTHMPLTWARQVNAGDMALVRVVAGSLGVLLVRWAKRQGAHVIGTVGNEARIAVAIGHGANHVVLYRQQDVCDTVLRLTGEEGVDYAIDGAGSAMLPVSLAVTRLLRMVASIGQTGDVGNARASVVDLAMLGPAYPIALARPGVFRYMANPSNYQTGTQTALQHMLDGVHVPVGDTYTLGGAATTHTALEAGQASSMLLLRP